MKKKARARRQRIPAFGEWNHAYGGDQRPVVTHYDYDLDSAMQARRLVVAIPMPPSPPKPASKVVKWRERATATLELEDQDDEHEDEKQKQQHLDLDVVVGLGDYGGAGAVKKQGKQSPVVGHAASAYKARRGSAVKTMDQDLYHIPPDMLCHEPRKRLTRRRSLWTGCLGLGCVVA